VEAVIRAARSPRGAHVVNAASRHAYALAHPVTDPRDVLRPEYAEDILLPSGNLLHSILAVDR
jgi:hypothetical protein